MDFFEHQEKARRQSKRLVLLFVLAVIAIVASIYFLMILAFLLSGAEASTGSAHPELRHLKLLGIVSVSVLTVVGLGSLYKMTELRGGGRVVAEALGGRLISGDATDAGERRVLNVVEEMAIASGVPVPAVYMMDKEGGINAFAAGFDPTDAVVGVTRGTVKHLSRDELQGVIAHEFSHILNGDMRLNIRLIGLIHGILVIGLVGGTVLRSLRFTGMSSRRRSSNNNGGDGRIVVVMLVVGLGLLVIGYVGTFFGNLIKSAVSRQREYLADASAVQFTRNPEGIAGALKKIGGLSFGSTMGHPHAPEMSHLFFGEGVTSLFGGIFATHPPLVERITRIDPHFDGKMAEIEAEVHVDETTTYEQLVEARRAQQHAGIAGLSGGSSDGTFGLGRDASDALYAAALPGLAQAHVRKGNSGVKIQSTAIRSAVDEIGALTRAHVDYTHELLESMPNALRGAAHEPFGARALIFGLMLDADPELRATQIARLREKTDAQTFATFERLVPMFERLDMRARLPLIDLAIPALRRMSPGQYQRFTKILDAMMRDDGQLDQFEWVMRHILMRHLSVHFSKRASQGSQHYSLKPVADDVAILLSGLAWLGMPDHAAPAFAAAASRLPDITIALQPREAVRLLMMDGALKKLIDLKPRQKRDVVRACAVCIAFDHEITVAEGELMRAICDAMGVPMPPLLPGQALV